MQHKARIAILVPGGIGINDHVPAMLDLLRQLSESFELSIYSFSRLASHPSLAANNCRVLFSPNILGNSSILKILFFLWRIRKDHAQKQFSAVHGFWVISQGITAVVAGKMLQLPSIVSLLGGDVVHLPSIGYGSLRSIFHRKVTKWCIENADRVTLLTRFQKGVMKANGIPCDRTSIIPFGVDTTQFSFRPHPLADPLEFVFIGNQ